MKQGARAVEGARLEKCVDGDESSSIRHPHARTTFHGRYFHVEDAILESKPVQKPQPPVMIAGGGEQLTLCAVDNLADAISATVAFLRRAGLEQHDGRLRARTAADDCKRLQLGYFDHRRSVHQPVGPAQVLNKGNESVSSPRSRRWSGSPRELPCCRRFSMVAP